MLMFFKFQIFAHFGYLELSQYLFMSIKCFLFSSLAVRFIHFITHVILPIRKVASTLRLSTQLHKIRPRSQSRHGYVNFSVCLQLVLYCPHIINRIRKYKIIPFDPVSLKLKFRSIFSNINDTLLYLDIKKIES